MASASVTGNDDELIAASVRRFRESTGLSQADLADQMTRRGFSYHQSTVFKIETGDRKVSASELRGLAEVFQVPIDAFFGTDSRPSMSVVIRSRERAERLQIIAVDMVRLSRQAMVEQGNLEDDLDTYESMVEQTELTTGEHDALARGLLQWRELATWRGFKAFFEDYYSDEFAKWRMYDEFKSERRPMGSVTSYETAAGKRYRARYRKPDHSEGQKRGFKTKRDAELFIASVSVSKARSEYIDATAAKITVGEFGMAWRANRTHLKPSTARVEESNWRVHVLKRWGATSLASVAHSDVQAWVAQLDRSPTTVRQCHAILSAILESAVRDKRLQSNPARGIRLPRKVGKERVYLSHDQVHELAKESRDKSTLVLVLAYCGLRWGEATGLRVRDLDALKRRLAVRENAVEVGYKIVVGTPKSYKVRSVPFPAFLSFPLAALAEGKGTESILFGDGATYLRRPDTRDGWFENACERVRKTDPTFPAHLTLHDLRHTAASLSISAGANVKAVQRMLGHASAAMTLDTYADLFEDDLDAVSAALDKAAQESIVAKKRPNATAVH